jgi:phage terminase large subunit-like protein
MWLEKKIAHGGQLTMGNVYIRTDSAGNAKPNKVKSTEKIDGGLIIMGLDCAIRNEDNSDSAYDSRGLLML